MLPLPLAFLLSLFFTLLPSVTSSESISISSYSPDLISLTASNFSTQVLSQSDSDSWLIEFYSPYCRHCKAFAPAWHELAKNKKYQGDQFPKGAKFRMARVDCIVDGDLCIDQGVRYWPRLTVYRDGIQQAAEFKGDREYLALSQYIDTQAQEFRNSKGFSNIPDPKLKLEQSQSTSTSSSVVEDLKILGPDLPIPSIGGPDLPATATGDSNPSTPTTQNKDSTNPIQLKDQEKDLKDALEAADRIKLQNQIEASEKEKEKEKSKSKTTESSSIKQNSSRSPNPEGKVLQFGKDPQILDSEKFKGFLEKDNKEAGGAVFVKFFAPWCPHCKAMAKSYLKLAESLKNHINVVEVDCEANKQVCMEFKVQSYPTLRMYNSGIATEFRGARDHDTMLEWASKAGSESVVKDLKDLEELKGANDRAEVVFLYLHQKSVRSEELQAVEEASKSLLSTPFHIYKTTNPELFQQYSISLSKSSFSHLLVFKDHSLNKPLKTFSFPDSEIDFEKLKSDLTKWISKNRYPLIAEIKSTNFNDIMFNPSKSKIGLACLSEIHHNDLALSTGIGKKVMEIELENFRNLARNWRDLEMKKKKDLLSNDNNVEDVIWAWIEADRWESALKKYYSLTPSSYPSILLIDGPKLEYYPLPYSSSYLSNLTSSFISSENSFSTNNPPVGSWLNSSEIFVEMNHILKGERIGKSSRSYLDQGFKGASINVDRIVVATSNHPILSFGFLGLLIVLFGIYLKNHGGGFGNGRGKGEKGPLPLGGNTKFD